MMMPQIGAAHKKIAEQKIADGKKKHAPQQHIFHRHCADCCQRRKKRFRRQPPRRDILQQQKHQYAEIKQNIRFLGINGQIHPQNESKQGTKLFADIIIFQGKQAEHNKNQRVLLEYHHEYDYRLLYFDDWDKPSLLLL